MGEVLTPKTPFAYASAIQYNNLYRFLQLLPTDKTIRKV